MTLLNYTDPVPTPPPTASATTTSYTDPTGEVWVAKAGVAGGNWFRARDVLHGRIVRSAAWNTSATAVQFSYDLATRDLYGMFSAGGWQVPIAGLYLWVSTLTGAIASGGYIQTDCQNTTAATDVGTAVAAGAAAGPGGFTATAVVITSTLCAANDLLKVFQRASTVVTGTTGTYTYSTLDYLGTG